MNQRLMKMNSRETELNSREKETENAMQRVIELAEQLLPNHQGFFLVAVGDDGDSVDSLIKGTWTCLGMVTAEDHLTSMRLQDFPLGLHKVHDQSEAHD